MIDAELRALIDGITDRSRDTAHSVAVVDRVSGDAPDATGEPQQSAVGYRVARHGTPTIRDDFTLGDRWEMVSFEWVGPVGSGDRSADIVRRLAVPGGWLYQVSTESGSWHAPTFVSAPPTTVSDP